MRKSDFPGWDDLLSAAWGLQGILPEAVQVEAQLANPLPYDLESTDLREYRNLAPEWHDWSRIQRICRQSAADVFDLYGDGAVAPPPEHLPAVDG